MANAYFIHCLLYHVAFSYNDNDQESSTAPPNSLHQKSPAELPYSTSSNECIPDTPVSISAIGTSELTANPNLDASNSGSLNITGKLFILFA